MSDEKYARKLRTKLEKALAKGRDDDAIALLEALEEDDRKAPRWPHKRGDVLRKLGRSEDAIEAYERAVELYADEGFLARAVAMARTILDLNPKRLDILERVDPQAARALQVQRRERKRDSRQLNLDQPAPSTALEAAPTFNHPAILPDSTAPLPPAAYAHPAILPDSVPPVAPAAFAHPAILPDSAPPPASPQAHPPALTPDRPPSPNGLKGSGPPSPPGAAPPPLPSSQSQGSAARPPRLRPRPITLERLSLPPPAPLTQPTPPPSSFFRPEQEVAAIYSTALAGAQELSPAADKGPDETRFENASVDGQAAIELDISELEWAEPEEEPSAGALLDLPLFPLFADVSKEALGVMVRGSELVMLADGQPLLRRGDAGDALFGIVEGAVSVVVPGRAQPLVLGEGEVVGESCLLKDEKRSADVVARGPVSALRIPRDVLLNLVTEQPSVAEVLLRMLVRRLLGNLLQGSPLFEGLDGDGRAALARAFETRRAAAGTVLAHAGKQMDGMYIALTGTLQVDGPNGESRVLGPGTLFGLSSLLTKAPSAMSVTARVNMVVLRLPASQFASVAMQHPMILAKFSELAHSDLVNVSN